MRKSLSSIRQVASTELVRNLNANLLEGKSAKDFGFTPYRWIYAEAPYMKYTAKLSTSDVLDRFSLILHIIGYRYGWGQECGLVNTYVRINMVYGSLNAASILNCGIPIEDVRLKYENKELNFIFTLKPNGAADTHAFSIEAVFNSDTTNATGNIFNSYGSISKEEAEEIPVLKFVSSVQTAFTDDLKDFITREEFEQRIQEINPQNTDNMQLTDNQSLVGGGNSYIESELEKVLMLLSVLMRKEVAI